MGETVIDRARRIFTMNVAIEAARSWERNRELDAIETGRIADLAADDLTVQGWAV